MRQICRDADWCQAGDICRRISWAAQSHLHHLTKPLAQTIWCGPGPGGGVSGSYIIKRGHQWSNISVVCCVYSPLAAHPCPYASHWALHDIFMQIVCTHNDDKWPGVLLSWCHDDDDILTNGGGPSKTDPGHIWECSEASSDNTGDRSGSLAMTRRPGTQSLFSCQMLSQMLSDRWTL